MLKLAAASLVATILAALLPIALEEWGHAYSLTLYIQKHYVLIENNSGVDDLKVTLANMEIKKLVATEISLENTGKRANFFALVAIACFFFIGYMATNAWNPRRRELDNLGSILKLGFDKATLNEYLAPRILPYFKRRHKKEIRALIAQTDPQDERQIKKLYDNIRACGAISEPTPTRWVVLFLFSLIYVLVTLAMVVFQ